MEMSKAQFLFSTICVTFLLLHLLKEATNRKGKINLTSLSWEIQLSSWLLNLFHWHKKSQLVTAPSEICKKEHFVFNQQA